MRTFYGLRQPQIVLFNGKLANFNNILSFSEKIEEEYDLARVNSQFKVMAATLHDDINQDSESDEEEDPEGRSQTSFFPSFSPWGNEPLGHSRPFYYQQEGAYSQRPSAFQNLDFDIPKYKSYKPESYRSRAAASSAASSESTETHGLLGSGNFGVISGGTFYNDNDKEAASTYTEGDDFFYQNGHGRPSFYYGGGGGGGGGGNPKPRKQEQFADFKDFADINAPSNPAYSQFVVVYMNQNDTNGEAVPVVKPKPKNIIESLALLDLETPSTTTSTETPPTKKLSKSKRKLAALLPEKKWTKKMSKRKQELARELNEPMLALS